MSGNSAVYQFLISAYVIQRDFKAERRLAKLLTDITEVPCSDGKLYVSPILDCFNGENVALKMSDNMKKELFTDCTF